MKIFILMSLSLCLTLPVEAAYLDLNLGLSQKSLNTTYSSDVSYSNNAVAVYAQMGRGESSSGILLGWNFNSFSHHENVSGFIDQTITSTDMGPAVRLYLQKDLVYSLAVAYGVVCKGKYKNNTVDETISGTSYLIKLGVEAKMSDHFLIGFSINDYAANYKTSVVNSLQTDVDYKDSWLYPAFSLAYQF